MIFYLGSHQPHWLGFSHIPLCVSRRTLMKRKSFPRAARPWLLDSGGFTEVTQFGGWTCTAEQYVEDVRRFSEGSEKLSFAAQQDWMCEPIALEATGKTVQEHQKLTVDNFLNLKSLAPELPFFPVLQGWVLDDYLRHMEMFDQAGVDLYAEPLVGVGSVCRRQHTDEIAAIFERLQGLRMHGFGVKVKGLEKAGQHLASADSLAWSYAGRRDPPLPGCTTHKNCANCWKYARKWYQEKIRHQVETPGLEMDLPDYHYLEREVFRSEDPDVDRELLLRLF
jgi:hypothetical protein